MYIYTCASDVWSFCTFNVNIYQVFTYQCSVVSSGNMTSFTTKFAHNVIAKKKAYGDIKQDFI
jgi:hypothetical protein